MPAWLLWTLAALLSWGAWAVLSKVLGNALTAEQSQALSTIGLLPILVPLAVSARTSLRGGSRKGLLLALVGGIVTCLGNIPYYTAVARGDKFATVVSLTALAPLVTVLLAVFILRERLNRVQLAGLALSLVAIWLFNVQDTSGLLSPTVLFALLPIGLWGLSGFLQKTAANHVSADVAALVYLGAFVPIGFYHALREPWPDSITPRTWTLVIALGFLLALGNFAILVAYARRGKVAVIAPRVPGLWQSRQSGRHRLPRRRRLQRRLYSFAGARHGGSEMNRPVSPMNHRTDGMDCGGMTPLWLHGGSSGPQRTIPARRKSGVVPPQSNSP